MEKRRSASRALLDLEVRSVHSPTLNDLKELHTAGRRCSTNRPAARNRATTHLSGAQAPRLPAILSNRRTDGGDRKGNQGAPITQISALANTLVSIPGTLAQGSYRASGLAHIARNLDRPHFPPRRPVHVRQVLYMPCCHVLQPTPQGKIRPTPSCRQSTQGCHHSNHAKARRARKCTSKGWPKMKPPFLDQHGYSSHLNPKFVSLSFGRSV